MAAQKPKSKAPSLQGMAGQRFGRWLVLSFAYQLRQGDQWLCRCDCGTEAVRRGADLRLRRTQSCGCFRIDQVTKHGHSTNALPKRTRTYRIWMGMNKRCRDPQDHRWHNYGGRGIKVCDRWRESFVAFLEDMGESPSPQHSIDRIDNDGNYCPENCRWATMAEQRRNSRQNLYLEYQGERLTMSDWAKRLGMSKSTLHGRLKLGWTVEAALSSPVHREFASNRAKT